MVDFTCRKPSAIGLHFPRRFVIETKTSTKRLKSCRCSRLKPSCAALASIQCTELSSLKWSDLKYVCWHQGGPIYRGRDTSLRRLSPSRDRWRFTTSADIAVGSFSDMAEVSGQVLLLPLPEVASSLDRLTISASSKPGGAYRRLGNARRQVASLKRAAYAPRHEQRSLRV